MAYAPQKGYACATICVCVCVLQCKEQYYFLYWMESVASKGFLCLTENSSCSLACSVLNFLLWVIVMVLVENSRILLFISFYCDISFQALKLDYFESLSHTTYDTRDTQTHIWRKKMRRWRIHFLFSTNVVYSFVFFISSENSQAFEIEKETKNGRNFVDFHYSDAFLCSVHKQHPTKNISI